MLISTNEAAALLADGGPSRQRTRQLLETGIAGAPVRAAGAVLYAEERVRKLCDWPTVDEDVVATACPRGLIVARLGPHRRLDLTDSPAEQRRSISDQWHAPRAPRLLTFGRSVLGISTPFVATVSGYVVLGAEVTAMEPDGRGGCRLHLAEPGEWYDALRGHRWLPGRGGPAMLLWGWPTRRAAASPVRRLPLSACSASGSAGSRRPRPAPPSPGAPPTTAR